MTRAGLWLKSAANIGAVAGLWVSAALAEAPDQSLRPVARDPAPASISQAAPAPASLTDAQQAQALQTAELLGIVAPGTLTAQQAEYRPEPRPFNVMVRAVQQSRPTVSQVWLAMPTKGLPLATLMLLDAKSEGAAPLTPTYAGVGPDGIRPGPLAALSSVKQPTGRLAGQEQRQARGSAVSVDVARLSRLFASTLSNRVRISRPTVIEPDDTMLGAAGPRPEVRPQLRPGTAVSNDALAALLLGSATAPLQTNAGGAIANGPAPGRPVARPALPPRAQVIPLVGPSAARPGGEGAAIAPPVLSEQAVAVALSPPERPAGVTEAYQAARAERLRGSVCGTPDIQGQVVSRVGNGGGCGIAEPVRITSISGVRLSSPATIDCTTAQALNRWVRDGAKPAMGSTGGGIASLQIMGSYSCRTRNNQPGARLSEHAKGRAVDIGGLVLRDGTVVSVLRHWGSTAYGAGLRHMHRAACGPFGTVLGPNANAAHRDHFHFDTARYRSGSYCR